MGFGMKVSLAKASTFGGIFLCSIPEFQREIISVIGKRKLGDGGGRPVGASLLAKIVNDNAARQVERAALGFFASKLASTVWGQWVPWKMMFSGLK